MTQATTEANELVGRVILAIEGAMQRDGVTHTELAKRLGIPVATVSETLTGRHTMSLRKMARILTALGYRAVVLLEPIGDE